MTALFSVFVTLLKNSLFHLNDMVLQTLNDR